MPFATARRVHSSVQSAAIAGAGARPIEVQVDLALGLPGFHLVGLPDHACQDARTRVLTALKLQQKLTESFAHAPCFWMAPVKDLLHAVIWASAFLGNCR